MCGVLFHALTHIFIVDNYHTWVKVFRIIPEFRILPNRFLTPSIVAQNAKFCRLYNSFSDLVSVYLKVFDH